MPARTVKTRRVVVVLLPALLAAFTSCFSNESSSESHVSADVTTTVAVGDGTDVPLTAPEGTTTEHVAAATYNAVERKIVKAFASLGFEATRDEMPAPSSASMTVVDSGGSVVLSASARALGGHHDYAAMNRHKVSGRMIRRLDYGQGLIAHSFRCDGVQYEIRGPVPPGYGDRDAFLADYIAALSCA